MKCLRNVSRRDFRTPDELSFQCQHLILSVNLRKRRSGNESSWAPSWPALVICWKTPCSRGADVPPNPQVAVGLVNISLKLQLQPLSNRRLAISTAVGFHRYKNLSLQLAEF